MAIFSYGGLWILEPAFNCPSNVLVGAVVVLKQGTPSARAPLMHYMHYMHYMLCMHYCYRRAHREECIDHFQQY